MKSSQSYRWLLFDADGTLFDYDRAEAKALEATFQNFGLPFSEEHSRAYQKINHQVWVDFENGQITSEALRVVRFERLFETLRLDGKGLDGGADAWDISALEFSSRYLQNLSQASDLMEGAEKVILALKKHYRLGLITNGLKDVQRPRLACSAIADCFDVVAISEEIGAAKPDPRYFDAVFGLIGQPPRETVLVIGDSLTSDIQGGLNYGLDTCWFNPAGKAGRPELPVKFEIKHLEELIALLCI